jgi:ankyrin repeat protein
MINTLFKRQYIAFSVITLSMVACNSANTKMNTSKSNQNAQQLAAAKKALPAWRRSASHTLTRGAKDAIFPAAKNGNLRLVKELLAEGVDVNYQNFNGETILHIAASRGHFAMVQYLLRKGANVNAVTGKNWQPIHHAMRFEHAQIANYLLANNASLSTKTSDGLTALELGKSSKKGPIQRIVKKYSSTS